MMSDPLVSQLLLVGLLWLCLMLYVVWPDDRATSGHTTSAVWSPRNLHPYPTDRLRDLLPNAVEVLTRELEGETP